MKKYFLLILIAFSFVSCDDDSDANPSVQIGNNVRGNMNIALLDFAHPERFSITGFQVFIEDEVQDDPQVTDDDFVFFQMEFEEKIGNEIVKVSRKSFTYAPTDSRRYLIDLSDYEYDVIIEDFRTEPCNWENGEGGGYLAAFNFEGIVTLNGVEYSVRDFATSEFQEAGATFDPGVGKFYTLHDSGSFNAYIVRGRTVCSPSNPNKPFYRSKDFSWPGDLRLNYK